MNLDVPFKVKNKLFCVLLIEIQYCRFSLLLKKYFRINVSFKANCKCYSLSVQPFHITLQQRNLESYCPVHLLTFSFLKATYLLTKVLLSMIFQQVIYQDFIHIVKSFRSSWFSQGAIEWFHLIRIANFHLSKHDTRWGFFFSHHNYNICSLSEALTFVNLSPHVPDSGKSEILGFGIRNTA